jgi:hypothetical protein
VRQTGAHAYRGPRRSRRRQFPPDIKRIIRRRRWSAWTAIAALAAIVLCGGTDPGSEFSDSRAHGIFIALVLAAWAAAVCLVNAGTFRLRRRGIYTAGFVDALFTPVRGWAAAGRRTEILPEWLVRLLFGVALLVCLAVTLPDQVNAVAYLTDSTPTAVFLPRSYIQDCGKDGCTTRTAGILQTSGLPAIWPAQLPLDRAILVQAPVWRADTSPTLMTSNPAVGYTLLAMIIDAAAASTLFGYILRLSRRLRRTRSRDRPGWLLSWLSCGELR